MTSQADTPISAGIRFETRSKILILLLGALALTLLQWVGYLPAWLHRLPEFLLPPFESILDNIFNFIKSFV